MIKRTQVAALAVSASALVSIANWEWFVGEAMIPVPGDVPTIGFGHTGPEVHISQKITVPRALVLLNEDANKAAKSVQRCAPVPMYQHEFDAFSHLTLNIGGGRFCASSIPVKLIRGDYAAACETILEFTCGPATNTTRAKKGEKCYRADRPLRVIPGLENRRKAEYQMCITNPDAAPSLDAGAVAPSGSGTK